MEAISKKEQLETIKKERMERINRQAEENLKKIDKLLENVEINEEIREAIPAEQRKGNGSPSAYRRRQIIIVNLRLFYLVSHLQLGLSKFRLYGILRQSMPIKRIIWWRTSGIIIHVSGVRIPVPLV
ncbi:MAG: hypothetical protein LBG58_14015 [Planctomycetaceae bacterium]|nr:hypothetical protein [Planctomycetaceae bacterium]